MLRTFRYLWTAPNTIIGIVTGWLLGGRFRVVDGVIEIESARIAWMLRRMWVPASAMTLGHVVLGQDRTSLHRTRRHERVHVRQYERWGIFFLPAYGICSLFLFATGRDGYRENPFEVEAYAVDDLVG